MTKVLILGDGPAGLATAIALRQKGIAAIVAKRKPSPAYNSLAETLHGSCAPYLKDLGLWESFLQDQHTPCYGNCSSWGSDDLFCQDFIQTPNGQSWQIDRQQFIARLYHRALSLDIKFINLSAGSAVTRDQIGNWFYGEGIHNTGRVKSEVLIDATGRKNWLGRQLRITKPEADRQIGAILEFSGVKNTYLQNHCLIEAVKEGWWYSGTTRNGRLTCIFFTDADILKHCKSTSTEWLMKTLMNTRYVKYRCISGQLIASPRFVQANNQHSTTTYGQNWLAVGDAALSVDPVSSYGLTFALNSALRAAQEVADYLTGTSDGFEHYGDWVSAIGTTHAKQRHLLYGLERRWEDHAYWKSRHGRVCLPAN